MKICNLILLLIILTFAGCEIFVIGHKIEVLPTVNLTQESALGAVYLFKAELDSNNIPAASQILAHKDGSMMSAIERYENYFTVARLKRMLYMRQVTAVEVDTLQSRKFLCNIEYDYMKLVGYQTAQIADRWYITEYSPMDVIIEPLDYSKFQLKEK